MSVSEYDTWKVEGGRLEYERKQQTLLKTPQRSVECHPPIVRIPNVFANSNVVF
jgi:hypothetical protein